MWNKIKNLWLDITTEEFQLTVWFPGTTKIDADGNKEVSKDPVQWKGISAIKKLTPTHIIFIQGGQKQEIVTTEPVGYIVKKIH